VEVSKNLTPSLSLCKGEGNKKNLWLPFSLKGEGNKKNLWLPFSLKGEGVGGCGAFFFPRNMS
jgi:hypothetical protein